MFMPITSSCIYIRKRDERINSIAVIRHIQGNRHTSVCTYIVSYVRSYFCCVGPVEMPTASNRCKEYIYIYLLFTLYTYYISRPYRLGWLALFIDIYNSRPVVVQCTYIIVSPNFDVFVCLDSIVFPLVAVSLRLIDIGVQDACQLS